MKKCKGSYGIVHEYDAAKPQCYECKRLYYLANLDREKADSRDRYAANRGRVSKRMAKFYQDNKPKMRERDHKRLARERGAEGTFTAEDWQAVVERQEGRCAHCNTECKLTVDHIVPLARGGTNWPENLQGLCFSCNSSKGARLESELAA